MNDEEELKLLKKRVRELEDKRNKGLACPACGVRMKSSHNLLLHLVTKHPEWVEIKDPNKKETIVSKNETMARVFKPGVSEEVDVIVSEIGKLEEDGGGGEKQEKPSSPKKNLSVLSKVKVNWIDFLIGLFVTFLIVVGLLAVL